MVRDPNRLAKTIVLTLPVGVDDVRFQFDMADVPASDLIDSQEIADWLGVRRRSVSQWHARAEMTGFPQPIISRPRLQLWSRTQVGEWALRTGRLTQPET